MMMDTIESDAEIRDLEGRLRWLAAQLLERSRHAGADAIELHSRGVALQRAAFVLSSELSTDTIDLRDPSAER